MARRTRELTFNANVKGWIDQILQSRTDLPFDRAEVEEAPPRGRKPRDLTIYDRDGKIALTGEVRMPDALDGGSPYAEDLVKNASDKAELVGAPYFFTWTVNRFVLWDRSLVTVPMLDRQCRDYSPLHPTHIRSATEVEKPWVITKLRDKFWPKFLEEFARLYQKEEIFGVLPPDEQFMRRLESFLERPVALTTAEIFHRYRSNAPFRRELNKWMVNNQGWTISSDEEHMNELLERAAKLSCFVLSNKLIFYEALRRSFPELKPLKIPQTVDNVDRMMGELTKHFSHAQDVTKDYETIFWPDYGATIPLRPKGAIDAWRTFIKQIVLFNLKDLDHDVLGPVFERLIDPEERHKYGQHYTKPEVVDLINAFCIREPDAVVMDPACGSGTFLIRAYARKQWLSGSRLDHKDLISQLYGTDISGFAAHLSCVGLASKDLIEAENYPLVFLDDFFNLVPHGKASLVPGGKSIARTLGLGERTQVEVELPKIDAGLGNPPYIRQEEIPKAKSKKKPTRGTKEHYQRLIKAEAPTFNLSGRSDIYVYFWPHLTAFLKEQGYLGLLTSSSWLDVEYGFRLQKWFLENFRIVAVIESVCEPWFTGARVATAVTIVQKCADENERLSNPVRFVQLRVPLAELLENDGTEDGRQRAAEGFRDLIEGTDADMRTDEYRILVVPQCKLFEDGYRLGKAPSDGEDDTEKQTVASSEEEKGTYRGGKWGVYLRAPDLYFEIMERYEEAFVPIGKVAEVRFGVKSGCDHFFYPRDHTDEALAAEPDPKPFKNRYGVTRKRVESGKVKIVKAGDGTVWPIEASVLAPVLMTSMDTYSPNIDLCKLDHLAIFTSLPKRKLPKHALEYVKFGEKMEYHKRKSLAQKAESGRSWYDIIPKMIGDVFWPKAHQYEHTVPLNSRNIIGNQRVYPTKLYHYDEVDIPAFCAILNSTLVLFTKQSFGKALGREGYSEVEVYSALMMLIPDPRNIPDLIHQKLIKAFEKLCERNIGRFLEETFWECKRVKQAERIKDQPIQWPDELRQPDRQELDDAVLELIGVADPQERRHLRERLYDEVARFYRQVRLLELQAIENKMRAKRKVGVTSKDISEDIWADLEPDYKRRFPEDFLQPEEELDSYVLPEGKVRLIDDMITKATLVFRSESIEFRNLAQAKLAKEVSETGRIGTVSLPHSEKRCEEVIGEWEEFRPKLEVHLLDRAYERTPDEEKAEAAVKILFRRIQEAKTS